MGSGLNPSRGGTLSAEAATKLENASATPHEYPELSPTKSGNVRAPEFRRTPREGVNGICSQSASGVANSPDSGGRRSPRGQSITGLKGNVGTPEFRQFNPMVEVDRI